MFSKYTKKATLVCMAFIAFIFSFGFLLNTLANTQAVASPYNITIVLDAGHGGIDGGSVGSTTGVTECELNLIYVNKLEKLLNSAGIKVIKTRSTLDGLYDKTASNLKKDDMKKRKEIIANSNAQAVISVHMNKFTLPSEKGSQVFYQSGDELSKVLADSVKDELVKQIDNARNLTLGGDYFICKCIEAPSIIVECGFLSNPQEEVLLQQEEYQDKLCYAVFCGILKYFNLPNTETN